MQRFVKIGGHVTICDPNSGESNGKGNRHEMGTGIT